MTFFLILVCEAIGIAATPGLLCQPRVIVKMIVDKQMECRLAGETEVLGENLPQLHDVTMKFILFLEKMSSICRRRDVRSERPSEFNSKHLNSRNNTLIIS
jgi:hypothetical protein